jgi:hypothetical protein
MPIETPQEAHHDAVQLQDNSSPKTEDSSKQVMHYQASEPLGGKWESYFQLFTTLK